MTGDAAARALAEALPATALLQGEPAAAHAVDGRPPRFVALPETVAQVSAVLAAAARHGLAVVPAGGGARLARGAPPRRLDLVLRLTRLDRIVAHEPADLTCSVQAGARLGPLDAVLRPHRQFVPLDPAGAEAATVGGLIATGDAGPYRARYGTMRDLLLGLTVVLADGTVVKGGGRVVKNVSGYDVPKLFVGSHGTLGVVVEAHLRLHPRPAEERSWAFAFPGAEAALEAAVAIRETPVVLSRCTLVTAGALRALGEPAPPGAALAVTIGSVPEAVAAQGARVAEICARGGAEAVEVPEADAWWAGVAAVTRPAATAPSLALRIGVRPTDAVKALRLVEATAPAGAAVVAAADLPSGVLRATLHGAAPETMAGVLEAVRSGLAPLGGTAVVEHAPAAVKETLDVWGDVGPGLEVMRRLKAELDPGGILSPGRFVGGI